jgi:hypothetical protein
MSRGARWILGTFAVIFAVILYYSEFTVPSKAPVIAYAIVAFCLLIAVACFSQSLRGPAVRVIGSMVFLATASYLVFELLNEPTKRYAGRSEPHWLNAVLAIVVFGLPGLYVAVRGSYPKWGRGASVFRSSEAGTKQPREIDQ